MPCCPSAIRLPEVMLALHINTTNHTTATYDHRRRKTRDPVRSPTDKPAIVRLVLGWVTTGESLMLYVFACLHE
ncbi:hypothetical protein NKR19_g3313 [Coniochaeta hoffmannii]|uniref:Uncharacterized protein n=1 Tax=Coniochaeta hoffmannii TaxID=91930 RepID=A0AA38W1J9_9PEZI|nr:hypothetical protein NKR19_g3313 [Coniochaeta hoffmannii]